MLQDSGLDVMNKNISIGEVIIDSGQIKRKVRELGDSIGKDFSGFLLPPVIIGVLNGSFVFLSDLIRVDGMSKLNYDLDFITLSSYKDSTESEKVDLKQDFTLDITNRNILIVEDIVDSGHTLNYLLDYLYRFNPLSIEICVLVDKLERRDIDVPINYKGFTLDKGFIVGYGMDYKGYGRHLSNIHLYNE